jgi:hypothetical protein
MRRPFDLGEDRATAITGSLPAHVHHFGPAPDKLYGENRAASTGWPRAPKWLNGGSGSCVCLRGEFGRRRYWGASSSGGTGDRNLLINWEATW